jgi:hypothetical protein
MAMGLVESLSRPGRNATGFSDILAELSGKFVDLAREVIKPQTTVNYLWHTAWPDGQNRHHTTEQAAQAAGMKLRSKGIADIAELDDALRAIKQSGSTTLIVQPSPFTYGQRGRIIASAMKNGLGTIFYYVTSPPSETPRDLANFESRHGEAPRFAQKGREIGPALRSDRTLPKPTCVARLSWHRTGSKTFGAIRQPFPLMVHDASFGR